jgi:hypothetical protein
MQTVTTRKRPRPKPDQTAILFRHFTVAAALAPSDLAGPARPVRVPCGGGYRIVRKKPAE